MRMTRHVAAVTIACGLVWASCGQQKADAAAIVQEGGMVAFMAADGADLTQARRG